jgi:hypothetical protein
MRVNTGNVFAYYDPNTILGNLQQDLKHVLHLTFMGNVFTYYNPNQVNVLLSAIGQRYSDRITTQLLRQLEKIISIDMNLHHFPNSEFHT